jgi:hypothetical protein
MDFGPVQMYDYPVAAQALLGYSHMQGTLLRGSLPSSLECLSLFEEHSSRSFANTRHVYNWRASRIRVLDGLAGRGLNLKHISISFLSDAMDCLKFRDNSFPNLQSLAITSQEHLQPTDVVKVREILLVAAAAVRRLPKLQIMELWTCEKGHAAIFRYEATETMPSGTCEITWRCSWHPMQSTLGARVMATWGYTAQSASRQLTLTLDPLPDDLYDEYGAILRHLKLRDFILDPVSAMQAQVGTVAEGQPEVPAWKASIPYSPV